MCAGTLTNNTFKDQRNWSVTKIFMYLTMMNDGMLDYEQQLGLEGPVK